MVAAGAETRRIISGRIIEMPHKINDDCVSCGACEAECPVEAISEGENKYVIDAATCTDCGSCVEVCPNDAIVAGD
jgi:ferredoxin